MQINIFRHQVLCGSSYQIDGFYLGATPEELNVKVEDDLSLEEKYYETEADGVLLFFVKVKGTFRLYRIVKEQPIKPEKIKSVLDNLKARYGTPDKQQIKTSSTRPQNRAQYITTVKNRAVWNVSETQEFIAEIESKRVVYELLDNDPENIKSSRKQDVREGEDFGAEGWEADF
jgi:hypothetical protein